MSIHPLEFLFKPKSIAIVGVSSNEADLSVGRCYVQALLESGFQGNLYPVNLNGGEIFGLRIYSSMREIPGTVDYVISVVPAKYALSLLGECIEKRVKSIHFYTAGFSEVGDEKGRQLEMEILKAAGDSGIRILGPNCMGIYCPASRLSFSRGLLNQPAFPKEAGTLALISQSGVNSIYCVRKAVTAGIYFSKVVSYGNAIDINETTLLEYLADDDETEIIAAYIEGIRDGRGFINALKKITSAKPVIICKPGYTEEGTKAVASHTSSIAGSNALWPYICTQTGAIQADDVDEMIEIASLFQLVSVAGGRNVVIFGTGGGPTVKATDDLACFGFKLPPVSSESKARLKQLYSSEAGNIFSNPLDLFPVQHMEDLVDALAHIAADSEVDIMMLQVAFDAWAMIEKNFAVEFFVDTAIQLKTRINKPLLAVLHYVETENASEIAHVQRRKLVSAGIPVFTSMQTVARAMDKIIRYQKHCYRH